MHSYDLFHKHIRQAPSTRFSVVTDCIVWSLRLLHLLHQPVLQCCILGHVWRKFYTRKRCQFEVCSHHPFNVIQRLYMEVPPRHSSILGVSQYGCQGSWPGSQPQHCQETCVLCTYDRGETHRRSWPSAYSGCVARGCGWLLHQPAGWVFSSIPRDITRQPQRVHQRMRTGQSPRQ